MTNFVSLIQIMDEASNPKAAALAQLKVGLSKMIDNQGHLSRMVVSEDEHGVTLTHPDAHDVDYEDYMVLVCGQNDVLIAIKNLRVIDVASHLIEHLNSINDRDTINRILKTLEGRVDSELTLQGKMEDHFALASVYETAGEINGEYEDSQPYRGKAKEYNDIAISQASTRMHTLPKLIDVLRGLTALYVREVADDLSGAERFCLSFSQMDLVDAQIIKEAKAIAEGNYTNPKIVDKMFDLVTHLEDDEVATKIMGSLLDKMTPERRGAFLNDKGRGVQIEESAQAVAQMSLDLENDK